MEKKVTGYIIKMNKLYGLENATAYWQKVGSGCFQFVNRRESASVLTEEEADKVLAYEADYCRMYEAATMEKMPVYA